MMLVCVAMTAALALRRGSRVTLVIAKLDRLDRDVHFISGLMKADGDFMTVDMPQANKLPSTFWRRSQSMSARLSASAPRPRCKLQRRAAPGWAVRVSRVASSVPGRPGTPFRSPPLSS